MTTAPARQVRVWSVAVRVLHWAGVAAVTAAWITSLRWTRWHETVGYAVLAIVALRLAWGWVGDPHARFASFVRGPRATLAYLRQLRAGTEPRHLGHNPLGGWMIVALLTCLGVTALSGWLYTTDRYWGDDTVSTVHACGAWTLLGLVALHLLGVIYTSRRQRENLVAAMLTGRKRAADQFDPPCL